MIVSGSALPSGKSGNFDEVKNTSRIALMLYSVNAGQWRRRKVGLVVSLILPSWRRRRISALRA